MRRASRTGDLGEVLRGSASAFVLRVLGAAAGFGVSVVVARGFGAEGTGIYYLALGVVTVASVLVRQGFENAVLRAVAAAAADARWGVARGAVRRALILVAAAAVPAAALVALAAPVLARHAFGTPGLTVVLRSMAPAVAGIALFMIAAEALRGLKRVVPATLLKGFGQHVGNLCGLLLCAALVERLSLPQAGAVLSAVTLGLAVGGVIAWRRLAPAAPAIGADAEEVRGMRRAARSFFVVAVTALVMDWTDTLVLGRWHDAEVVGTYGVALRVARLVSFALVAVNTISAPKYAELHARGRLADLESLARRVCVLLVAVALAPLAAMVLAPGVILGLFGEDFTGARGVLVVLALGQAVNVMTGSIGYILMMTGHERDFRNNAVVFALVNVALNLALVPRYGALGAAWATATCLAGMNLVAVWLVRRRLGLVAVPIPGVRGHA